MFDGGLVFHRNVHTPGRWHRNGAINPDTVRPGRAPVLPLAVEENLMKLVLACDARGDAKAWTACLEQSPALRQRLLSIEERELRKMFGVGALTNSEALMPEQVSHKHKHPNTLTRPFTHSLNTGACSWVYEA